MKPQYLIISLLCAVFFGITLGSFFKEQPQPMYKNLTATCEDSFGAVYKVEYLAPAIDKNYEQELCRLYKPGKGI